MGTLDYQKGEERRHERHPALRKLFGPSQSEIWKLLADGINARFIDGGWRRSDRVIAEVGEWTVTLDTFTVHAGNAHIVYTRLRAPYVNRDGFRFSISRAGFFSGVARFLGAQDISIGDPPFDETFVIKSSSESQIRLLLADPQLRAMISAQPRIMLEVKDDEGWFGARFPDGVDELKFTAVGVIKDLQLLEQLFELFAHTLHRLTVIGSAYETDPNVTL